MKIRFIKTIELEHHYDICCFSGFRKKEKMIFSVGLCLTILSEHKGEKVKAKGGAYFNNTLFLLSENQETLHPDRLINVPSNCYEVIE